MIPQTPIEIIRHSLSHLLAAAVKKKFPQVQLGIGPAIESGFYYDFQFAETFSAELMPELEKEMRRLISEKQAFQREEVSIDQALELFQSEPFKIELIQELKAKGEQKVSIYRNGSFLDLCAGPHVANSQEIPADAFSLDRTAGAYWRGDSKNPMLTRIYGLAFSNRAELAAYQKQREEAVKRDHRTLGKDLGLFTISHLVGKGLPLLLPKGATLRRTLERFIVDEELKRGYLHVYTPVLGRQILYEISGHLAHYAESMYPAITIEDENYRLRPMTCPHHFMIYADQPRSYKELPLRLAEISTLYRRELSGELYGLIRLMGFHLADAHIFCTPGQIESEFRGIIDLITYCMRCLGLEDVCWFRVSLRDDRKDKYVDNPEGWQSSEKILLKLMQEQNMKYLVSSGDAAFYGPKVDVQIRSVNGKEETIFTNQLDMALAERFKLTYIDSQNQEQTPIILHRSSIGCLERTMAFLIEHYAGAFPTWLAPVQIKLLNITDKHQEYAAQIHQKLLAQGLRSETNFKNITFGKKMAETRKEKVPYLGIVGDQEMSSNTITVKNRDTQQQANMPVEELIQKLKQENDSHSITLECV